MKMKDKYLLSSQEKSIFFAAQVESDEPIYNDAFTVYMNEKINVQVLKSCFDILINRHEILRTTFIIDDGLPYQVI